MTGKVEDTIRELAAEGHSRIAVAEILCISRHTLNQFLADMAQPPKWASHGRYIGNRLANEAQRGVSTPERKASAKRASEALSAKHARTYCGFTGSIIEIAERFEAKVSHQTIYHRLSKGMSMEAALTLPPQVGNRFTKRKSGARA